MMKNKGYTDDEEQRITGYTSMQKHYNINRNNNFKIVFFLFLFNFYWIQNALQHVCINVRLYLILWLQ